MFSLKQIRLFIILGILLLICLLGLNMATANIRKSKNAPAPKPTLNPRITPYVPTPTPAGFRLL